MDASGAGSNRVNIDGLNSFIDNYESKPGYTAGPMNDSQAARILNYHSPMLDTANSGTGGNGKFNGE